MEPIQITVEASVKAPIEKVWTIWNGTEHIVKWNSASPDWHTPRAQQDFKVGGTFSYRMEAKDGSFGFDFGGTFTEIVNHKTIAYTMGDGRKVKTTFTGKGPETFISSTFEAETQNPVEMQKGGWQAILDNFKSYTEAH